MRVHPEVEGTDREDGVQRMTTESSVWNQDNYWQAGLQRTVVKEYLRLP